MSKEIIPFIKDAGRKKNQAGLFLGENKSEGMSATEMAITEIIGKGELSGQLVCADCLSICGWLKSRGRTVDLVYIDPPFGSGGAYASKVFLRGKSKAEEGVKILRYNDKRIGEDYLVWIADQLRAIRSVMSERGSIYVHLDWHICHYVKVLMDEIFGEENFINEIIWSYKSGGASKGSFARKHDTIYLYAFDKSKHVFNNIKEKSYNRELKPYRFKGVAEYQDEKGWYTLVNMRDVWEIDMVGRTSKERVDYATQKPEALLERIILSSSDPGMTVADFFGGSGVMADVALKNNRKFIHGDINTESIYTTRERLMPIESKVEILCLEKENKENDSENELSIQVKEEEHGCRVFVKSYKGKRVRALFEEQDALKQKTSHISEKGLEMIEYISVDCENKTGPWHSTEEIHINKKGNLVQHGIELNMPWDGTILSEKKIKRIKIRNIIGEEKILITT